MKDLHQRLVREIAKRRPDFRQTPETQDRLALAAQRLDAPLPDDYALFLSEVGPVPWPMKIGNLVDFDEAGWPRAFRPFAEDGAYAHGFLRASATQLRIELADFKTRRLLARDAGGLAALAAAMGDDGESSALDRFEYWLEDVLDDALASEQRARGSESKKREASLLPEHPRLRQTLDLFDRMLAEKRLEASPDFDEEAAARKLAPSFGDWETFLEKLLELPGVEEVYASDDDMDLMTSDGA